MGAVPSKESLISRQIDQNLQRAAEQRPRLLCLGEPLPPVSSTLACDFVQLPQPSSKSLKWLNLLAAASRTGTTQAIVFTVPLTWYEQCNQDGSNQLQQAMEYFKSIRRHFSHLSIIIILTDRPDFTTRIRSGDVDLVDHFPYYPGAPEDPVAALAYVRNEFKRLFYESRTSDDWATLYVLYDDGCKQLRSKFIAQAIHAIRKTDSFAHMNDMLTPYTAGVLAPRSTPPVGKTRKRREEERTIRLSSDESCSESTSRI